MNTRKLEKRNRGWNTAVPSFGTFPSIFDEFFDSPLEKISDRLSKRTTEPAVNIKETENAYELELAVPGLNKEDFNINLEDNHLTISVESSEEKVEETKNYTRKEFNYSTFRRSFVLPENLVDREQISAKYENGILYVNVPKREEAIKKNFAVTVQ